MLMMMRADDSYTSTAGCTAEELLACITADDYDACIAACSGDEEEETDPVEVKIGKLNATIANAGVGGDIPHSITALPVVTYKFTADEDINITALTLEQVGFGDDDAILGAALFIDGKRVSNVRNLNINTKRVLNLSKAYTVKKGGSVDIEVRATVGNSWAANQQFAVKLTEVNSSAKDTVLASNLTSNTFKIVGTEAATLAFDNRSAVIAPKVGVNDADIFEFAMTNSTNQDIKLYTVTLMWSGSEARNFDDYLKNLGLEIDGNVIATAEMEGKYLTFKITNGYLVEKNKTPVFTVKADVVGGASKTVDFTIENVMDVVAIAQTHNTAVKFTKAHSNNSAVEILAGRVTIERTNPVTLDFVGNRTNVFLGSFDIINNAGGDLRLEDFKVTFNNDMTNIAETVKARFGSVSAGLVELNDDSTTVFSSDTEMNIGSKLTVYLYADTVNTWMNGKSFYATLSDITIRETQNDIEVTDKSMPSKWATMNGKEWELTLTRVFLPNKSYSKGTANIDALSFKIKAGAVYGANIKKMTFKAAGVNTNTVSSATLYRGTTAIPATVVNGEIRINNTIFLDANETAEFKLNVNLASNPTITTWFAYSLAGDDIEAEDNSSDRNTISISNTIEGRTISVVSEGTVTFNYETNADNNKNDKSILAGNPAVVAEYSLFSNHEDVRVKNVEVTFNKTLDTSIGDLELYYGDTMIASDPTWTLTGKLATFSNVNFDVVTTETPLTVKVISTTINADGGNAIAAVKVTKIELKDLLWKDSGNTIANKNVTSDSQEFDILPTVMVAGVKDVLATSATLTLTVDRGSNTTTGWAIARATLTGLEFSVLGNNGGLSEFRVELNDAVVWTFSSTWALVWTFNTKLLSAGENEFKVYFTQSGAITTPSYTVRLNNVVFTTNVDSNVAEFSNRMPSVLTIINK